MSKSSVPYSITRIIVSSIINYKPLLMFPSTSNLFDALTLIRTPSQSNSSVQRYSIEKLYTDNYDLAIDG